MFKWEALFHPLHEKFGTLVTLKKVIALKPYFALGVGFSPAHTTGVFLCSVEMQDSHVFRNYSTGEVSTRLYLKNLSKQVEEKVCL